MKPAIRTIIARLLITPEAFIWAGALLLLACFDPAPGEPSLCLFRHLGIPWCPGCGLGHSITSVMRGDLQASVRAHPLGPIAVLVLLHRIIFLLRRPLPPRTSSLP